LGELVFLFVVYGNEQINREYIKQMVDLYCERLGPNIWAEPINALTNLAFFVAAGAAWRLVYHRQIVSFGIWLLIGLIVTIGAGSMLFHTFATNWARALDVLPILFFQLVYLGLYSSYIIKMRYLYAVGLLIAYLIAAYFGRQFPYILNGSLIYAPAFLLMLGLGLYHYSKRKNERTLLLIATGVFTLSLFFRSIDHAICPYFSIGTHFFWHLFNSVLLYLLVRGLLVNISDIHKGNLLISSNQHNTIMRELKS
jgi:uncharacterized membrane protein